MSEEYKIKLPIGQLIITQPKLAHLVEISSYGKPIVTIKPDATVIVHNAGTEPEAARIFYESLELCGKNLYSQIADLTAQLAKVTAELEVERMYCKQLEGGDAYRHLEQERDELKEELKRAACITKDYQGYLLAQQTLTCSETIKYKAEINALKCQIEGDHCSMCPEIASLKADAKVMAEYIKIVHSERKTLYQPSGKQEIVVWSCTCGKCQIARKYTTEAEAC